MDLYTRKPYWLNKKVSLSSCQLTKELLKDLRLNTVCQEAACPNIGECFPQRQATFLILGKNCTRQCGFCAVAKGIPAPLDPDEPRRVAEGVKRLNLRHAVITSVTRDDLSDGGAGVFAQTIGRIKSGSPAITVEVLIPDFVMNEEALRLVARAGPDIIAHNAETVPRLYPLARKGADYARSLAVLAFFKRFYPEVLTKSGLMLGLGERPREVIGAINDLKAAGVDFLSIGQYLSPSIRHLPVAEYIRPEQFSYYKEKAERAGFKSVLSGPYVRSSYAASRYLLREECPGDL